MTAFFHLDLIEVILHTGSNLGNEQANLSKALYLIEELIGPILKKSQLYITEPWGLKEQSDFYNQAILCQTELSPKETLSTIHLIEKLLGRIRGIKWQSRLIDIDMIFFGVQVISEEGLTIPHKHLHERNFVLVPLNEIIPDFIHPVFKKSIAALLEECEDDGEVKELLN